MQLILPLEKMMSTKCPLISNITQLLRTVGVYGEARVFYIIYLSAVIDESISYHLLLILHGRTLGVNKVNSKQPRITRGKSGA